MKAVAEAYVPRPSFVSQLTARSYKGAPPWPPPWLVERPMEDPGRRQGTARLGPDVPANPGPLALRPALAVS